MPSYVVRAAAISLADDPLDPAQIVSGNPQVSGHEVRDADGLAIGIWQHTAGVSTDVEADEVFVVLTGRATIEVAQGPTLEIGPGDLGVLEAGAQTTWHVHEDLRKVYVIRASGAEQLDPGPGAELRDGYVADVRRKLGHDLLLLPAVSVHIRDEQERLLLVRKVDTQQWGTVGGAIEPAEAPRHAATREAYEETGLDVELTAVLDVVGGPDLEVTYPNGDRCAYVSTVYEARVVAGDPRPDGVEISEADWFSRDEIASLDLEPVSRAVLTAVHAL